jgi:hypothetical protein
MNKFRPSIQALARRTFVYFVTRWLKAGIVEQEEAAVASHRQVNMLQRQQTQAIARQQPA